MHAILLSLPFNFLRKIEYLLFFLHSGMRRLIEGNWVRYIISRPTQAVTNFSNGVIIGYITITMNIVCVCVCVCVSVCVIICVHV